MCGIAGVISGGTPVACGYALRMADQLRHRGPNDEGYLTLRADDCVDQWGGPDSDPSLRLPELNPELQVRAVLAHRRLSIIDLSTAGHQPMCDHARRRWIVFNGEIYNYLELRRELMRLGHSFSSETDTEVLLAAFREWSYDSLKRFRGMFAFAMLDLDAQELVLARDPFGIKPLYYSTLSDGHFAFASEMKALVGGAGSPQPDADSLFQFLRFGLSDNGDRTMFSHVRQVPPGSFLRVDLRDPSRASSKKYWSLPFRAATVSDPREAGEIVAAALRDSVRVHMRSDVPVGSCLSGGLDSTAIVAIASEMMSSSDAFGTISFISDDDGVSEKPYVSLAERQYRIRSHHVGISVEDVERNLRHIVRVQDVPFGSLSIYAQFAVFREAAAQGLTVMLDGQGSDELLGGYYTAVSAAIAERFAGGRVFKALRIAREFDPIMKGAFRRTMLSALGRAVPTRLMPGLMAAVGEPLWPDWLDRKWFADRGVRAIAREQGRGRNALDDELRLFTERLSLPQLLRYEDRNSMAFSIESRVPFCDVEFASAVASLSTDMLVTDTGETKAALKNALRGTVPDAIIDRRKLGFNTPDAEWLSSIRPWILHAIKNASPRMPFIRTDLLSRFLEDPRKLRPDLTHSLWRVVSTLLWADVFDVVSA